MATLFEVPPVGADTYVNTGTSSASGTINLSPGETEIITFDMTGTNGVDAGTFSIATMPAAGSLFVTDASTGAYFFTITAAEWHAAGSPSTLTMSFITSAAYISATYTLNITCFAAGTGIATPSGEVAVESLQIGDTVLTQAGKLVSVKWLGRQTVSAAFAETTDRLQLIRVRAGSLGNGIPHSDLTVTADHGMLIDVVICHAGALVNGTTITRVPLAETGACYTVYHVETEEHDIILANGAPAETFIDNVSRRVFDNYPEFEALYGDVPEMEELPYPRAMSARQLPASVRQRIGNVAAA